MVCPFCKEEIAPGAVKCKHCGEFLDPRLRTAPQAPGSSNGVTAVLSFLVPGLSQMYGGRVAAGSP